MSRSRPFKIQKGTGGLEGAARSVDRQGSGANNKGVHEFLKRGPVQGSAKVRVIPRNVFPAVITNFVDGGTEEDVNTVVLAFGGMVGPIPAESEQGSSSQMVAEGTIVGPISAGAGLFNSSVFIAEGTVV